VEADNRIELSDAHFVEPAENGARNDQAPTVEQQPPFEDQNDDVLE
jgi:hypothetical protein